MSLYTSQHTSLPVPYIKVTFLFRRVSLHVLRFSLTSTPSSPPTYCTLSCAHTRVHVCVRACARVCVCARVCARVCMCTCVCVKAPTHVHVCIHEPPTKCTCIYSGTWLTATWLEIPYPLVHIHVLHIVSIHG